jgi:hypothetical protein
MTKHDPFIMLTYAVYDARHSRRSNRSISPSSCC